MLMVKERAAISTSRSWLDISVNEDTVSRLPRTDISCVARKKRKVLEHSTLYNFHNSLNFKKLQYFKQLSENSIHAYNAF